MRYFSVWCCCCCCWLLHSYCNMRACRQIWHNRFSYLEAPCTKPTDVHCNTRFFLFLAVRCVCIFCYWCCCYCCHWLFGSHNTIVLLQQLAHTLTLIRRVAVVFVTDFNIFIFLPNKNIYLQHIGVRAPKKDAICSSVILRVVDVHFHSAFVYFPMTIQTANSMCTDDCHPNTI